MKFNIFKIFVTCLLWCIKCTKMNIFFINSYLRLKFIFIPTTSSYTRKFRFTPMILIMSIVAPFKIFNSIIKFIRINMIDLWKIIRVWYKSFSDQTMNILVPTFRRQINNIISTTNNLWFQKLISFYRKDSSIRINNIIIIEDIFFHNTNIQKIF